VISRGQLRALETRASGASPAEAAEIACRLLDLSERRGASTGWLSALQRRFGTDASRDARSLALRLYPSLDDAGRSAVRHRLGAQSRAIAAEQVASAAQAEWRTGLALAVETPMPDLLPALAGLTTQDPADRADAAADAMPALAALIRAAPGSHAAHERALAACIAAVEQAARERRQPVLTALLLLLTPAACAGARGPAALRWLEHADEATRLAARGAIKALPGPAGAAAAWQFLASPAFRRAAIDRLAAADSPEELRAANDAAHLGCRPSRASAVVAGAKQLGHLLRPEQEATASPIIARVGLADRARPDQIEPLIASPGDTARLAAARSARGALLLDAALDHAAHVAALAASRMAFDPAAGSRDAPTDRPAASDLLRRSPHEPVRRLAVRAIDPRTIAAEAVRLRRRFQTHPAEVLGQLTDRIESDQPDAAVRAAVLVARLGLAEPLLHALSRAARSAHPAIAAAAVRALGGCAAPQATAPLAASLGHDDPRVRANAAEAAGARARRRGHHLPELTGLLDDHHHRPASTALRVRIAAGIAPPDTGDRLKAMLTSPVPERRLAGLWLTDRAAREIKPAIGRTWADLAAIVAGLSRSGATDLERSRATRCARRMLAEMNA
jgi:hypothetical protein